MNAGHNASSTDRASCSVAMATAVADRGESFVGQSHLLPDGLCLVLERLPLTGFLQRLVPASSQTGLHVTAGGEGEEKWGNRERERGKCSNRCIGEQSYPRTDNRLNLHSGRKKWLKV